MNNLTRFLSRAALVGAASAAVLLTACAMPIKPDGADAARAELTALQSDSKLAVLAPVAIQEAEEAVRAAEAPTEDVAAGQQAVYVAQGKISIARAQAERRLAEDNVKSLGDQRNEIRLDARTREAEIAKAQAEAAAASAMQQQAAAQAAQQSAQAAMSDAAKSKAEAEELKRQMLDLEARATDRGMVMTLGDVLFSTGRSDLKPGAMERLNKLAGFMLKYPDRGVVIEGHTDSTGSAATNMTLSQQRADAVKAYLISQSVPSGSVTTVGKGKDVPVADNTSATGRQQNRRVEIIIANVMAKR